MSGFRGSIIKEFKVFNRLTGDWLSLEDEAIEFLNSFPIGSIARMRYIEMRSSGESHNIAKMLTLRKSPHLVTDATFLAGHVNNSQFDGHEAVGQYYRAAAEAAGVSTAGSVYLSGLARYPGDPEAWVSSRADVSRIARARGWGVQGAVTVPRREAEPLPDVPVADDIIESAAAELMCENPGLSPDEARERAIEIRSGAASSYVPRVQPLCGEALTEGPENPTDW